MLNVLKIYVKLRKFQLIPEPDALRGEGLQQHV